MKIALIGRTQILYDSALRLHEMGHEIVCILTSKEAPEYKCTASDFKSLANIWNIPFQQGSKIVEFKKFLSNSSADLAVSINYTGIIPQSIIDLFPLGILNAHGGDLPRYRGNACQSWAIINGEDNIGLCIHKMIGGELDSGNIIVRDYFPIDYRTKVTQVWEWMEQRTPELMLEAVDKLAKEPTYFLERQSQDPKDALRCYPRKPEDGRIDWNKSSIEVLRLINASNKPYAGAFCELEGEKLIIWDAELVDDGEIFCAIPGQVTMIREGFVEVACKNGKLRLMEVEYQNQTIKPSFLFKSIRKRLL